MLNSKPTQSQLFQFPYLSEGQIRELVQPYYARLWPVIMVPWEDLLERRGSDQAFNEMPEEGMAIWLTWRAEQNESGA